MTSAAGTDVPAQRRLPRFAPLSPGGYTIGMNEGKIAGRSIDHLHIHLIPRYEGDVADPRGGIRQVVPNHDPDAWVTTTQPSSPTQ
ncbi:MAG: HIT family protein [Pseudonocardiaceae bacterium]